jgi:hypothetical protein
MMQKLEQHNPVFRVSTQSRTTLSTLRPTAFPTPQFVVGIFVERLRAVWAPDVDGCQISFEKYQQNIRQIDKKVLAL